MRMFIVTVIALFTSLIHASTIEAKYDISFSFIGKIGEAYVLFEHDDRFYHIYAGAGLVGAAASMANNRRETHESFGDIKDGVLVPTLYKKTRSSDHRFEESYFATMPNGSIKQFRFKRKEVFTNHFDFRKMRNIKTMEVEKSDSSKTLPYKAKNDLLSLFFNMQKILDTIPQGSDKIEHAVGARNDKGEIRITNPNGKKRQELARLMPKNDNRLITVLIDQDIFKSGQGELYLNLDAKHLAIEAMLKDVLLFGDVKGSRVWMKGSL